MTPDRRRLGTEDGEHARAPCGKQAWDGIEEKTPQPSTGVKLARRRRKRARTAVLRSVPRMSSKS